MSRSAEQPFNTPAPVAEVLRRLVVELSSGRLAAADIDAAQPLLDAGYVDSLSAVILLARIEEIWGVQLDDSELLEGAASLAGLARAIDARCGS